MFESLKCLASFISRILHCAMWKNKLVCQKWWKNAWTDTVSIRDAWTSTNLKKEKLGKMIFAHARRINPRDLSISFSTEHDNLVRIVINREPGGSTNNLDSWKISTSNFCKACPCPGWFGSLFFFFPFCFGLKLWLKVSHRRERAAFPSRSWKRSNKFV